MKIKKILIAMLLLGANYIVCMEDDIISDAEKFEYCHNTLTTLTDEQCLHYVKSVEQQANDFLYAVKKYNRSVEKDIAGIRAALCYAKRKNIDTEDIAAPDFKKHLKLLDIRNEGAKNLYMYVSHEPTEEPVKDAEEYIKNYETKVLRDALITQEGYLYGAIRSLPKSTMGRKILNSMRTRKARKGKEKKVFYYFDE